MVFNLRQTNITRCTKPSAQGFQYTTDITRCNFSILMFDFNVNIIITHTFHDANNFKDDIFDTRFAKLYFKQRK